MAKNEYLLSQKENQKALISWKLSEVFQGGGRDPPCRRPLINQDEVWEQVSVVTGDMDKGPDRTGLVELGTRRVTSTEDQRRGDVDSRCI